MGVARAGFLAAMMVKLVTATCVATASSTCNDGVTFLQSISQHARVKASNVESAESTCNINDLNQGLCDAANACTDCNLQGTENLLPTDAERFPDGRLLCEEGTCSLVGSSLPITFKEPSQVMVCKGPQTCLDWVVQDFGALCCSSESSDENDETCGASSNFELEGNPLCQNDVCCDGFGTCVDSSFNGVESLLCQGEQACSESTFYLSRDLYCNEFSPLTIISSTSGGTCSESSFFFTSENHVVDCLGHDVCSQSTMSFSGDNVNISMLCDSAQGGAGSGGACVEATINLSPGDCLDLNCTQPEDCVEMTVNENGGTCYFIGSSDAPNIPPGCEQKNNTQCGPIIPDEICCRDDPLCGSCCEEASTTVTPPPDVSSTTTTTGATTTSTKKKPKPYQYSGRNRRQHRRWDRRQRRQHRRDYRYG